MSSQHALLAPDRSAFHAAFQELTGRTPTDCCAGFRP